MGLYEEVIYFYICHIQTRETENTSLFCKYFYLILCNKYLKIFSKDPITYCQLPCGTGEVFCWISVPKEEHQFVTDALAVGEGGSIHRIKANTAQLVFP